MHNCMVTVNFPFKTPPKNNSELSVALISECAKIYLPCLALYLEWRLVIGAIFMLIQYIFLQLQKYPKNNHERSMNEIAASSFKLSAISDSGELTISINHLWHLSRAPNWTLPSSTRQHRASRSTGPAAGNSTSWERLKERPEYTRS